MTDRYFANFTGANCTFGGQTLISWNSTEDIEGDYASASAVCLAPGGPWPSGTTGQPSIIGGVNTGLWCVEESSDIASGERTWRMRSGDSAFRHIPLVSYRLRRHNYLLCRATISKATIGSKSWPPKFCNPRRHGQIIRAIDAAYKNREITSAQTTKEKGSWTKVADGRDLINRLASVFGLPISYRCGLPTCAEEYIPVSNSLLTAIKEVASWSSASCYLGRTGTLYIYKFEKEYGAGPSVPQPAALLSAEMIDRLAPTTLVTVTGKGYKDQIISEPYKAPHTQFGRGRPDGYLDPGHPAYTWTKYGHQELPVEYTQPWGGGMYGIAGPYVEDRIEVSYHITPAVAQAMARERLLRAWVMNQSVVFKGPGEGVADVRPLTDRVFSVGHMLEWTGKAYRFEVEFTGPTTGFSGWGSTLPADGGWF